MRWQDRRESENIEDRRGQGEEYSSRLSPFTGVGLGLLRLGGGKGIFLLIAIYIGLTLFGYNPMRFLFGDGNLEKKYTENTHQTQNLTNQKTDRDHFIASVLAETEDTWDSMFQRENLQYKKPILVRYSGSVQSNCGFANAAMGPFYCGEDQKLYLDDSFFDQLSREFKAPGEFAQAYVIAHEVGHHVQKLLGTLDEVNAKRRFLGKKQSNALSVKLELQADCYAGIWAHYTKKEGILEPGDIESALQAAYQIGDDTLEKKTQGYVVPDSFTHGTSAQRVYWFKRGFQEGTIPACNTFSVP